MLTFNDVVSKLKIPKVNPANNPERSSRMQIKTPCIQNGRNRSAVLSISHGSGPSHKNADSENKGSVNLDFI
jgi:hypothetical protein